MSHSLRLAFYCIPLLLGSCMFGTSGENAWKKAVNHQAKQLGFRNWIVIAEASFPAFNRTGIRQINANAEIPEALSYVLQALDQSQHVHPNIYLTRELRSMKNEDAPGVDELRAMLQYTLESREVSQLEQDSLLTLMADANRSFDVLVVRTTSALPYANVFIELQPGYWDAQAEQELRDRMDMERQRKLKPSYY